METTELNRIKQMHFHRHSQKDVRRMSQALWKSAQHNKPQKLTTSYGSYDFEMRWARHTGQHTSPHRRSLGRKGHGFNLSSFVFLLMFLIPEPGRSWKHCNWEKKFSYGLTRVFCISFCLPTCFYPMQHIHFFQPLQNTIAWVLGMSHLQYHGVNVSSKCTVL